MVYDNAFYFILIVLQEGNLCKLVQLKTSEKAWIWDCYDISDDASKFERLCAKFVTKEGKFSLLKYNVFVYWDNFKNKDYETFKVEFEKACNENKLIKEKGNLLLIL